MMSANSDNAQVNIYSAFKASAEAHRDAIALKGHGGRGRQYTYGEMLSLVDRFGAGLHSMSGAGECIGLLSENRPEWPIAYLAILASGKTVVPIDANLKPNEIAHIIDNAELKTVIVSGRFENMVAGFSSDMVLLSFDEDSPSFWENILAEVDETHPADADSVAVLIYTSGTTGNPKAVMLTHRNIVGNIRSFRCVIDTNVKDTFLSVLPLHHTFEATVGFLFAIMQGCCIVYARSLKSKEITEDVAYNKVTLMVGVPLLYEKMYHGIRRKISKSSAGRRALFSSLLGVSAAGWKARMNLGKSLFASVREKAGMGTVRLFVSGGAALPPEIGRFFNLIGFKLIQGYGLTECSPVVSANLPSDIKFGSVGPPLDNLEVRIDNPDDHGIGEILVRGVSITPGYRNNPEETSKLLRDGWLYTGDLGRLKDGHLWITGRQKNVIVSAAGKNIYPEELEEVLLTSLYVMEAVVVGRTKNGKQGEEVRAIVVPDLEQFAADFEMDPEAPDMGRIREVIEGVVGEVNGQVASYKRISGFEIQIEELEKTSTKKVKRFLYG